MATASSHTPAESSIPPSLLKAHERIRQLESENLRLRHLLDTRREQIEELAPGYYNLTDDGDFNGPARSLDEIESCVTDYTNDGDACTVVQVIRRYMPEAEEDDYGVAAGIDFPVTLFASAGW